MTLSHGPIECLVLPTSALAQLILRGLFVCVVMLLLTCNMELFVLLPAFPPLQIAVLGWPADHDQHFDATPSSA